MRKILALLALGICFLFLSVAAAASTSTFSLSGWTASAGQPERFTIKRTSGIGAQCVAFKTGAAGDTAQAGADFTAVNMVDCFTRYQTTATVQVSTLIDQNKLGQTLRFSGLLTVNSTVVSSASAAIVEPAPTIPPPVLSVINTAVDENAGTVMVHVARSGSLTGSSSFSYGTADVTAIAGINYSARSGTLIFAAGVSDVSFPVPVLDDGKMQGDLIFNVLLSAPTGATLGQNGGVTVRNTDVAPAPTQTCPDGSVIPATSVCPPPPPPVPAPGTAIALTTCQSLNGNGGVLNVGQSYTIVGYAGFAQPGGAPPAAGTTDIVILDDATHRGDGWFGLYAPVACVAIAP